MRAPCRRARAGPAPRARARRWRALRLLHQPDFVDEIGALIEQPDDLLVEGVDLLADLGKGHG